MTPTLQPTNGNGSEGHEGDSLSLPVVALTLEQRIEILETQRDQFLAALKGLAGFFQGDNPMSRMILMSMPKELRKKMEEFKKHGA